MLPKDDNCSSQFGFRDNRGTTFAAALSNDVTSYFRHRGSTVYTCSLDAEKCFDSIWHSALPYKLRDKISTNQWLIMYRSYPRLKASVRMNGSYSNMFRITRGMRQGSVLSPRFFCILLNSLLVHLECSNAGVRIGPDSYQSFAYAHYINLFSATVGGLQSIIDICLAYSNKWYDFWSRFILSSTILVLMLSTYGNLHWIRCSRYYIYQRWQEWKTCT